MTFEWDPKNEVLEIHGNKQGIENLRNKLDLLIASGGNDHIHLMTKEWGGEELSSEKQATENHLIHGVKIFKWE